MEICGFGVPRAALPEKLSDEYLDFKLNPDRLRQLLHLTDENSVQSSNGNRSGRCPDNGARPIDQC